MTGLVKTSQRRQGPNPRLLWLLVGTPSVLGPELASRLVEYSLLWRMSLYKFFDILFWYAVFITLYVCVIILWSLRFSWLLVLGLYTEDYLQIFKWMFFLLHSFCGKWEGWDSVNLFHHTSWMDIVTPTDRPKSVRSRCVFEVFGGVFVLSRCFWIFLWVSGFLAKGWVRSLPFSLTLNSERKQKQEHFFHKCFSIAVDCIRLAIVSHELRLEEFLRSTRKKITDGRRTVSDHHILLANLVGSRWFYTPPPFFFWYCVLLYLRSPKVGCCSISVLFF